MTTFKLSNDVVVPAMGFGCAFGNWTGQTEYQGFLPEEAWSAVPGALRAGFRHLDMAKAYGTHRIVGSILGQRFADGTLKRSDLFLTTKICHPDAPPHIAINGRNTFNMDTPGLDLKAKVLHDFEESLEDLGVGYVDMLLMHWPAVIGSTDGEVNRRCRKEAWEVFEMVYKRGQARAIGVSNFTQGHLEQLIEDTTVMPMVNQVEVHPYCTNEAIVSFCQSKGIQVFAYAPFGSGGIGVLQDATIIAIAEKYGRNVGQVILRWLVQRGIAVLPKSSSEARMRSNLDIDFEIASEDVAKLNGLNQDKRSCPNPNEIP